MKKSMRKRIVAALAAAIAFLSLADGQGTPQSRSADDFSFVMDAPFKDASALDCRVSDPASEAAWLWKEGEGALRVFRCRFAADGTPVRFRVTADQRYILKLDGERIGSGPDGALPERWTYRTHTLALKPGEHVLEAIVRHGGSAPLGWATYRAGFLLAAEGAYAKKLTTGRGPWRVATVDNVVFGGNRGGSFGVGVPETVTGTAPAFATLPDADFTEPDVVRPPYPANAYCHTLPGWRLKETILPPQMSRRLSLKDFPKSVTIPAHATRSWTIDLGDYYCARPELTAKGGRGASVVWAWAENARRLEDPFADTFRPEGAESRFTLTDYRAGRWCRLTVTTADEPLTLSDAALVEDRSPLTVEGSFVSDDPSLLSVAKICRRSLEMCCHDTTVDCPFYERLQYLGDTRVQFAAHRALTRDDRPMKQAVETFETLQRTDGLFPMNGPIEGPASESPTYSMIYALILGDYAAWHGDRTWLRGRLPALAHLMEGLSVRTREDGLLENLPGWNFIDWTDWQKGIFPGAGPESGKLGACENLLYAYALARAAFVAHALGEEDLASIYDRRRSRVAAGVRKVFWDESRGLFADDPRHTRFSEHAAALAILSGVLTPSERARVGKSLADGTPLTRASVYFSHYLFDAFSAIGRTDLTLRRLDLWRGYVKAGSSTTPEGSEHNRSDCHGWGGHPLYHFAADFAGIQPAAPFFSRVRIAPQPGGLKKIVCTMPHPKGLITVDLTFNPTGHEARTGSVEGAVTLPEGLEGTFVWMNDEMRLVPGVNRIAKAP